METTDNQIINLNGVSKRYAIYQRPADRMKELLFRKQSSQELWALQNASFSVLKGEALGIIGENGAGKSTLLSIISGIAKPTSGTVSVKGKLASLLELGVGFHPEFSGIQNIRLYGAMLGLSAGEINRDIDAIIDFSELKDAVHRPLKTYSTGMTVRLAFAVAITIEPEILVIDEALSVGDIHFQKKSFDAILDFKEKGGTLLFCSHSTYHVIHLCEKALWLQNGLTMKFGDAYSVVEAYENYMREKDSAREDKFDQMPSDPNQPVWIQKASVRKNGHPVTAVNTGDTIELSISLSSSQPTDVHIAVGLDRNDGINIYATSTEMTGSEPFHINGSKNICLVIENMDLLAGEYNFIILVMDDKAFHVLYRHRTANFSVVRRTKELGIYKLPHKWRTGDESL
jgi:ABC-type polysaccharide/polyol phosphate transport system ATPase subunit